MSRIYKILIIFLIFFSLFIFYLSFFGIKTDRFNPIILKKLAEKEKNIKTDIDHVYIKLDFLNLSLKLITNNPTILVKNIRLNIEEIETNISLVAFFSKKPVIKNLIIYTDKNDVKDLVKIYRLYQNNFQTMMLDKVIEKGITKFQFYLNFNKNGKIKDDYYISGKLNNFKIKLLNKKTIDSNLVYSIKKNQFSISNLNFNYDIEQSIIGGVVGYLTIWIIIFLYKNLKNLDAMGVGDAKLMAAIGTFFGLKSIPLILSPK